MTLHPRDGDRRLSPPFTFGMFCYYTNPTHKDRPVKVYRPQGCAGCNYSGYRGRVGIFELMLVDDAIRQMVSGNVDSKSIKNKAQQGGMHSLRSDGARKVLQGITSVAEVLRATEEEGVVAQI